MGTAQKVVVIWLKKSLDSMDKMCLDASYSLYLCLTKIFLFMGKIISFENTNAWILNQKLDKHIASQDLKAKEDKCRMVQVVLRHKVHKFPVGIPIVAAVKSLENGKVAVFNIKRSTAAIMDGIDIASETNIGREFAIDGVRYILEDTINGFPRYKPQFK